MSFTLGTADFTNGSQTVGNVNLSSGQLSYFSSGTAVFIPSQNKLVEAIGASGGDISLRLGWDGTTGNYAFVAFDTIEGLRDAVQSARGFSEQLQAFVESAEVNPVANSFVKRTSTGAGKVANAVNADEAVALGQLNTRLGTSGNLRDAATRGVGTSSGNVAEYSTQGLSGYGYGNNSGGSSSFSADLNLVPAAGFYSAYQAANMPTSTTNDVVKVIAASGTNADFGFQIAASGRYNPNRFFARTQDGANWQPWAELMKADNLTAWDDISFNRWVSADNGPTTKFYSGFTSVLVKDNIAFQVAGREGAYYARTWEAGSADIWKRFAMTGASENVSFGNVTAASLNVSGSKNFRIDNPVNPDEYLYHSAIESDKPRTQYIIEIDVDEALEATHTMPDWFMGLNGNTCTVFCSPCKHFGAAYGDVVDGVLTVTANAVGKYHILIMAERSDNNIADWVLTEPKSTKEDLEE